MKCRSFLLGTAAALAAPAIHAQTAWPHGQPIRVIVRFPAGAANDAMGRLAAQRLQDKLGGTVVARQEGTVVQRLNGSLLEPVVETIAETKAFIAAEGPRHVALLRAAKFEAQ